MTSDPLLVAAAVIAVTVAVVESQRRTNAQTSARNWHRSFELEHRVVEAQATVIRRLETALGRPTRAWVPLGHQPNPAPAPTPLELARVVCPVLAYKPEDRWMIRRRTHEQVAA